MGKRFTWLKELLGRWALPKKNAPALPPTDPLCQAVSEAWSQECFSSLTEPNVFQQILDAEKNLQGVPMRLRDQPASLGSSVAIPLPPVAAQPAPTSEPAKPETQPPQKEATPAGEYTQENYQKLLEQELLKAFGKDVKIQFGPPVHIPLAQNASPPATPPAPASAPPPASTNKGHMEQALEHGQLVTRTFDRKGRLRSYENSSRLRELQGNHFNVTRIYFFDPQADVPLEPDFEKVADQMGPLEYLRWLLKEHGGEVKPYPEDEFEGRRAVRKFIRNLKSYRGEKYLQ